MKRAAALTLLVLAVAAAPAPAAAEVGWAGSVRLGVGSALDYARAGLAQVDVGMNMQLVIRRGAYDETWGAGPMVDLHTLGFHRHDVTAGVSVSTPDYYNLFAGGLRAGVGYRWLSDDRTGAIVNTTILFSFRIPIRQHEELMLGVYADGRVLLEHHPTTELTTGIEIDPVGLLSAVFQKTPFIPAQR